MGSRLTRTLNTLRTLAFGCVIASFSALSADQPPLMNLDDKEQLEVQSDLFWLTVLMWVLIIGLVVFAYSIRYIAKRTTRPCHWCSEFISNKATICPRCGKPVESPGAKLPAVSRGAA